MRAAAGGREAARRAADGALDGVAAGAVHAQLAAEQVEHRSTARELVVAVGRAQALQAELAAANLVVEGLRAAAASEQHAAEGDGREDGGRGNVSSAGSLGGCGGGFGSGGDGGGNVSSISAVERGSVGGGGGDAIGGRPLVLEIRLLTGDEPFEVSLLAGPRATVADLKAAVEVADGVQRHPPPQHRANELYPNSVDPHIMLWLTCCWSDREWPHLLRLLLVVAPPSTALFSCCATTLPAQSTRNTCQVVANICTPLCCRAKGPSRKSSG